MTKYSVDKDECLGCGNCGDCAPENFKLNDDAAEIIKQPETVEEVDNCDWACSECPGDAIEEIIKEIEQSNAADNQPARQLGENKS